MIRLIIMECFFDEKRHNVRLIEQSRNNRYVKKKSFWKILMISKIGAPRVGRGVARVKIIPLSSFLSSVKQIRAVRVQSAQRGTEGAKRKNEFMERSLDGRTVKERLLSGRFTSRASRDRARAVGKGLTTNSISRN